MATATTTKQNTTTDIKSDTKAQTTDAPLTEKATSAAHDAVDAPVSYTHLTLPTNREV